MNDTPVPHGYPSDEAAWEAYRRMHHGDPKRAVLGRKLPGSVYYPGRPPDDDDFWQWCAVCAMWHRHAPCF